MPEVLRTEEVPSASNPRNTYTVTVYDTYAHCSCPAWQNSRLPSEERVCKHVESVTGEMRKGDARLTNDELAWVIRQLLSKTDSSFRSIAAAIELECSSGKLLSDYERKLSDDIVMVFRGSRPLEVEEAPGPDAQQALSLILRVLDNLRTSPGCSGNRPRGQTLETGGRGSKTMRGAPSHTHSLRANAIQRGQVIGKAVSFSETARPTLDKTRPRWIN